MFVRAGVIIQFNLAVTTGGSNIDDQHLLRLAMPKLMVTVSKKLLI